MQHRMVMRVFPRQRTLWTIFLPSSFVACLIAGIDQMKRETVVVLHERYINLNEEEEEKINIFTIKNRMKWNWHFTFALHVADEIKFIIAWNISRRRKEKCNNISIVNWKNNSMNLYEYTHRHTINCHNALDPNTLHTFPIASYLNSSEHFGAHRIVAIMFFLFFFFFFFFFRVNTKYEFGTRIQWCKVVKTVSVARCWCKLICKS